MDKAWWKEAVIYQIYPRSFKDSNGDGVGDLRGIIEQLDYLQTLGVDVVWLSPIYQSPNDDNGYDISDYYNVMDEFGTMDDFDELQAGLRQRNIRLVLDLVVNHTSDDHPWFQASRKSKDNTYRDYYYWRPEPPSNWFSFFGGPAWEQDPLTSEYYLHLFTRRQPDLNWENPEVRREVYKVMRFWLDKGVDGFRMDVIPLISKNLDFPDVDPKDFNAVIEEVYANGPRVHEFLQEMHREVMADYDMMTIGEGVGIPPKEAKKYVGAKRKELNMIFHFGHMFIDHGAGGKFDIVDFSLPDFKKVFTEWHDAVGDQGWLNVYLDNHDFPRMVSRFGNDRLYRVESAKMLATLLLTMRGTPCIYQGSELGMTNVAFESIEDYRDIETLNAYNAAIEQYKDHKQKAQKLKALMRSIHQQGRDNQRTPMQWDDSPHAGFTKGEPWIKVNPNYEEINAREALDDPDSVFHYYRRMIDLRRKNPTLVYGEYQVMDGGSEQLFAYRRYDEEGEFFIYLNFSSDRYEGIPIPADKRIRLVMSNYKLHPGAHSLRPWEARVYQVIR